MKAKDIIAVVSGFLLVSIAVGVYYTFGDAADVASVILGVAGLAAIGKGIGTELLE